MIAHGIKVMLYTPYGGMATGIVMATPSVFSIEENGQIFEDTWPDDLVTVDIGRPDGKRLVRHVEDVVVVHRANRSEGNK